MLDAPRARARLEGQGRGGRAATTSRCGRPTDTFIRPHVIRLLQYVRVPRAVKRRISRRALFARDGWRCVYCGTVRRTADARPRRAALTRRRLGLGERRHGVRAVQPAQGRPPARGGVDDARRGRRARPRPVLFIRLAAQRVPDAGASTSRSLERVRAAESGRLPERLASDAAWPSAAVDHGAEPQAAGHGPRAPRRSPSPRPRGRRGRSRRPVAGRSARASPRARRRPRRRADARRGRSRTGSSNGP